MDALLKIHSTSIQGITVVETRFHADLRGTFGRLYCEQELATVLGNRRIVQINLSHTSTAGAIRGLHFQHQPQAEMKLVRCLEGRVWDVAVDLRPDSASYLNWHAEELSAANARMLVIPEGCAHGFQALEPNSKLLYLHTAFYTPEFEGGIRHDDPRLAILWPLPVRDVSSRDANLPFVSTDTRESKT
jgi:dTDP-4-dehydrorhamnose 3,5-epimerase